ncbi:hypothetical protein [Pseudomonas floridensis]|uniref:hypothetical protein n=1 Tax=Pseudomonas floridensis TaxID=1958950 RepID=UPI0012FF6663|nr:hypothetical protein [Pseudomonas floridensis]
MCTAVKWWLQPYVRPLHIELQTSNDLAELTRWCESRYPFSLDPAKTAGKDNRQPANLVAELVGNGKAAIKKGLDAKGMKLEDVVISESRKHLHVNLSNRMVKRSMNTSTPRRAVRCLPG